MDWLEFYLRQPFFWGVWIALAYVLGYGSGRYSERAKLWRERQRQNGPF